MPELPDITVYVEALQARIVGRPIESARTISPFVLRTVEPPIDALTGRVVSTVFSRGKRIVLETEGEHYLVAHLMIAGRLRWIGRKARLPGRISLAAIGFPEGVLVVTEAAKKKRASLHVLAGRSALTAHYAEGLDLRAADAATFCAALCRGNNTLKRALTDPRRFCGIGNAYSDEILHAAGLSPVTLTQRLTGTEIERLRNAARETLQRWTDELRRQFAGRFPGAGEITAFRDGFAVHGRFGKPCPACGTVVQRIRYAENETNYCPRCQTGGRMLADRSLSRLLRDDWPRRIEDWESG